MILRWFTTKKSVDASRLSSESDEDSKSLIHHRDSDEEQQPPHRERSHAPSIKVIVATSILWLLSLIVALAAGAFIGRRVRIDKLCTLHVTNASPLTEDLDLTYHTVRFNGSLMHENIYRQSASPEVDAAWEALGIDYRALIILPSQASLSGLTPSHVHLSPQYGGGYPANIEGLHHLHCLNLLRQSLYYNYAYYQALGKGAFSNPPPILRFHVSHCLDILRQQLMCAVDVSVLGKVWYTTSPAGGDSATSGSSTTGSHSGRNLHSVAPIGSPGGPLPFPDFNTPHKCRDFEAVRKWAEERQQPEVLPGDYYDPPRVEDVLGEMP